MKLYAYLQSTYYDVLMLAAQGMPGNKKKKRRQTTANTRFVRSLSFVCGQQTRDVTDNEDMAVVERERERDFGAHA